MIMLRFGKTKVAKVEFYGAKTTTTKKRMLMLIIYLSQN